MARDDVHANALIVVITEIPVDSRPKMDKKNNHKNAALERKGHKEMDVWVTHNGFLIMP